MGTYVDTAAPDENFFGEEAMIGSRPRNPREGRIGFGFAFGFRFGLGVRLGFGFRRGLEDRAELGRLVVRNPFHQHSIKADLVLYRADGIC